MILLVNVIDFEVYVQHVGSGLCSASTQAMVNPNKNEKQTFSPQLTIFLILSTSICTTELTIKFYGQYLHFVKTLGFFDFVMLQPLFANSI